MLGEIRFTRLIWSWAALAFIAGGVSTNLNANTITMDDYPGGGDTISCNGIEVDACFGFVGNYSSGFISLDNSAANDYTLTGPADPDGPGGSGNEADQLALLNILLGKFDPARAPVTYVKKTDGEGDGFSTNRQFFSVKKSTDIWYFENLSGGMLTIDLEGDTENYSNWTEYGAVVPVPAAVWLFGTALIGFIGFSRRTKVL